MLSAALAVCLIFSVFTLAADEKYDSSVDPLISYSYLEARIGELRTDYENEITDLVLENETLQNELDSVKKSYDSLLEIVNDLVSDIESLKKNGSGNGSTEGNTGNSSLDEDTVKKIAEEIAKEIASELINEALADVSSEGTEFVAVFVPEGGIVYPAGNSLEIILRSGNAVVVSPFENQGLSNITNGTDMGNGKSLTLNHQLLIPRNDGRGVKITSVGGAYVMIRGEYLIG